MKFKTYENPDYGFKIKVHPHWNIQRAEFFIAFLSPLVGTEDQYRENLNIARERLPVPDLPLDEYVILSKEQLRKGITNFRLLNQDAKYAVGRGDNHKLLYNGTSGKFYLKFMQIFFIKEFFVYILTYTAENNHFEEFFNEVKKMIKSFRPT